jgi:hypothetical protein
MTYIHTRRPVFFIVCSFFLFSLLLIVNAAYAQPEVDLVMDPVPENNTIYLESGLKEIWLEIRVPEERVGIEWTLDGPGEFTQIAGGIGGIYRRPDEIESSSATATITVLVADDTGNISQQSVEFELIAPPPTPTPTPTPTPVPVSIRQVLLQHEKFYLKSRETVVIVVQISTPSTLNTTVECAAIKGTATCASEGETSEVNQLEVSYTAPEEPGKDMLEIRIHDTESGEIDLQLVKIEILDK